MAVPGRALVAATAYELGGWRHAAIAALLAGGLGCSPFIESFTLSGELVAALPAVASAWCFLRWLRGGGAAWVALAGVLTGCAVMVKQSAFDAGLAAVVSIVLMRPAGWRRALALLGAGVLV